VDEFTKRRVFEALKANWFDTPEGIAAREGLGRAAVLSALSAFTQAGRAVFDLAKGVYRARELSREPLPLAKLRFASEREEAAARFVQEGTVSVVSQTSAPEGATAVSGAVKIDPRTLEPSFTLDSDGRMISAECTCNFFSQNKLRKGPCEHLLALRMVSARPRS
jgi:hypothetical protein